MRLIDYMVLGFETLALQELYRQASTTLSNSGSSRDNVPFNWRISKVEATKNCDALPHFDFGAVILDKNWDKLLKIKVFLVCLQIYCASWNKKLKK